MEINILKHQLLFATKTIFATVILTWLCVYPVVDAKGIYLEPATFINNVFSGQPPVPSKLTIKGQLADDIKNILEHRYKKIRLSYWQHQQRTVWILEEIGKERPITAGFVVENNKIQDFKVLVFRESRGWEIRNEFFTRQFSGAYLKTNQRLDRHIDNITGATMSVNAMKKLSRMALYLHNHVTTQ